MAQTKISPKTISISFAVLVLAFLFGFYIFAWQEPNSAPPGGNVAAPLNTGPETQTKQGGLNLATQTGKIGIGTNSPQEKLEIAGNMSLLNNELLKTRIENLPGQPFGCDSDHYGYIYYDTNQGQVLVCGKQGWQSLK